MFGLRIPGHHAELRSWALDRTRLGWLAASLALVIAPHAGRLPIWVSLCFVLLTLWRILLAVRGVPIPSRWLLSGFGFAMLAGVLAAYGTPFGRGPGIALLAVLAGMKLMETHTARDAYVVCALAFFLVITNFLYSQSIPTGAYMLVVVLVITATLVTLTVEPGALGAGRRLGLAATLIAQAVPLMALMFVLFPRVSGPLWGLPKDAHAARSGLSNSMSPGRITRLSLSDEVAFRVAFDGAPPPAGQLYWRGPVLWLTDGRTWTAAELARSTRSVYAERLGAPVDYVVTLEPHQERWLFALDVPVTVPRHAFMTRDYQLRAAKPVRERIRYRVRSHPDYVLPWLSDSQRDTALQLPPRAHPRARALAAEWRRDLGRDDRAVVERALAYFRTGPFHYTLSPPPVPGDFVDGFLFGTRRGFCEYYAAAFTVLMRAAGIPTRVVTGYQGGELNPLGGYLIVRQRDAHAWTEVWLDDGGWVRIDPTAAVAPDRIERGMDAAIPPTLGAGALRIQPSEPVLRAWQRLRQTWDAANNAWNQWVLGYGPQRQRWLLARLGFDARSYSGLAAALAVGIGTALIGVGAWMARRPATRDPLTRSYARFCAKLARAGVTRAPSEGPVDFARRVCADRPTLAAEVRAITGAYVGLRYGRSGVDPRVLGRAVARFRP